MPHLLLALADVPQSPSQGALRLDVCMLPAQPHVCACNPASSVLELPDHSELFVDAVLERTERNWLVTARWLLTLLIAEGQQVPGRGTRLIDEPLVGMPLAVHAHKRRCEVQPARCHSSTPPTFCVLLAGVRAVAVPSL